jgi:hypothetical protein
VASASPFLRCWYFHRIRCRSFHFLPTFLSPDHHGSWDGSPFSFFCCLFFFVLLLFSTTLACSAHAVSFSFFCCELQPHDRMSVLSLAKYVSSGLLGLRFRASRTRARHTAPARSVLHCSSTPCQFSHQPFLTLPALATQIPQGLMVHFSKHCKIGAS